MTPAAFQRAVSRGMAASPFAGELVLKTGTSTVTLTGCVIDESDNKREQDEYGAEAERVLSTHIPKSQLTTRPDVSKDLLLFKGRTYAIKSVEGDEDHAAAWAVEARSPMK